MCHVELCHVCHVMCHVSCVMGHGSRVSAMCHMSYVPMPCVMSHRSRHVILPCHAHVSYFMCYMSTHVSCVIFHVSCVMCHMTYVIMCVMC
jgi:hypothetical protein